MTGNHVVKIDLFKNNFIGQAVSLKKLQQFEWKRQQARTDGLPEGIGEPSCHMIEFISHKKNNCYHCEQINEFIVLGIYHLEGRIIDILCFTFAEPDVCSLGVHELSFLFKADYERATELISNVLL